MTIHHQDESVTLHHGDCLDILRELADNSVDSVVTDPPYGLEFMGKSWDAPWKDIARADSATTVAAEDVGGFQDGAGGNPYSRSRIRTDTRRHGGDMLTANRGFQDWCEQWTAECLRVLKPGGHLLAFGGSRTWHRLASAVEDAGFEIRDSIAWLYGSGFPKSLDVSKAIDKAAGAERTVIGPPRGIGGPNPDNHAGHSNGYEGLTGRWSAGETAPATDEAQQWEGWGTALKPAFEPIVVGRKPFPGTVAINVLEHGTGALNIGACRTPAGQDYADKCASVVGLDSNRTGDAYGAWTGIREDSTNSSGRWPTNVVLDQTQAAELDTQSGMSKSSIRKPSGRDDRGVPNTDSSMIMRRVDTDARGVADRGGASRFFPTFRYQAKAPAAERPRVDGVAHPTVKPLEFMRWLVRLATPPGGIVLEPFAGSGTTIEAALIEGFQCIAIERETDYLPLIMQRLDARTRAMTEAATKAAGPVQMSMLDLFEDGGAA